MLFFFELYSSKSIFWYKNQASLTLQWNFMRQNWFKNVAKREAEGSFFRGLKEIYAACADSELVPVHSNSTPQISIIDYTN